MAEDVVLVAGTQVEALPVDPYDVVPKVYVDESVTGHETEDVSGPGPTVGVRMGVRAAFVYWSGFEANVSGHGYFECEVNTDAGFDPGSVVDLVQVKGTWATFDGLTSGATYYFRVRAVDAAGTVGAWTATIGQTPDTVATGDITDGAVTDVKITSLTTSKLTAGDILASSIKIGNDPTNGYIEIVATSGATEIKTSNFVSGSAGWRIRRNGNAEFNDVVIRGELHTGVPSGEGVDIVGNDIVFRQNGTIDAIQWFTDGSYGSVMLVNSYWQVSTDGADQYNPSIYADTSNITLDSNVQIQMYTTNLFLELTGKVYLGSACEMIRWESTGGPMGLEFQNGECNLYYRTTPNTLGVETAAGSPVMEWDVDDLSTQAFGVLKFPSSAPATFITSTNGSGQNIEMYNSSSGWRYWIHHGSGGNFYVLSNRGSGSSWSSPYPANYNGSYWAFDGISNTNTLLLAIEAASTGGIRMFDLVHRDGSTRNTQIRGSTSSVTVKLADTVQSRTHSDGAWAGFKGTAFTLSSDPATKQNAVRWGGALTRLRDMKAYRYEFIGSADRRRYLGFMADEVPDEVRTGLAGSGEAGISLGDLTTFGIVALQELAAEVDALRAQVAALTG